MVQDVLTGESRLNFYTDLSPTEYVGMIQSSNHDTQQDLRGVLKKLPLEKDQCLVVAGSDGKGERHSQSKTEFVVIQEDDHFPLMLDRMIRATLSDNLRREAHPSV